MPCKGCEKECKCTKEKCDPSCKCSKDNKCNCHGGMKTAEGEEVKSCCHKDKKED